MFSAEGAASDKLKGSNEVTSDPVGPLLASYVERLEYVMRSRALPPMRKYCKLPAELLPTARRQQVPKSRIDNSTGRRPPQDVVFAC
jgi:hypothetical protein